MKPELLSNAAKLYKRKVLAARQESDFEVKDDARLSFDQKLAVVCKQACAA